MLSIPKKKHAGNIALLAGAVILAGSVYFLRPAADNSASINAGGERIKITVYRSPTCGCCGNYIAYLKKRGFDVETEFVNDTAERQSRFAIPEDMGSCHTSVVGNYVVEGHVPVEAIQKLLDEKPNIRGIAMPGMPSGSPGMPGPKRGGFTVYELENDGSTKIFETI